MSLIDSLILRLFSGLLVELIFISKFRGVVSYITGSKVFVSQKKNKKQKTKNKKQVISVLLRFTFIKDFLFK